METTFRKTCFMTFSRLPARYGAILMPMVLSILMTFVVSLIATVRAIGFTEDFMIRWLPAWGLSWFVAFPTLLLVLPLVRRIVNALVEPQRS
ncbi:hypothetical protein QE369_004526 [Agrobacterium larrymoorei]|uniref:DUF2798 domain-containing protein n=2 Tax=Rhizobium/Agrobacterium group TaxID=227290 RepID=A0AAJ2BKH3_9HYPH|nr:hypothetical protein [Agrobacterium larrymoorei]